jgi:hypothetical protein
VQHGVFLKASTEGARLRAFYRKLQRNHWQGECDALDLDRNPARALVVRVESIPSGEWIDSHSPRYRGYPSDRAVGNWSAGLSVL